MKKKHFTQARKITNRISRVVSKRFNHKVKASGRYVKVKATNFGTIPCWHLGAGGDAYIFIDEIIIK